MKNFKPGQEVVCTKKGKWITFIGREEPTDRFPQYNQIYHVTHTTVENGIQFVMLAEFNPNQGFTANWFEPVVTDKVIADLLQEESVYSTILNLKD